MAQIGSSTVTVDGKDFTIDIIDSVSDYAEYMKEIFDFGAIKELLSSGLNILIDSMNGGKVLKQAFDI